MAKRKMLLQKIPVHTTKTGMKRTFKLNSKKILVKKKVSKDTSRITGQDTTDYERY